LQKTVKHNDSISTTRYIHGFQYYDNVLQFFHTPEGYVKNTPTDNGIPSFDYVYQYRDHLNNVRVNYAQDPQTGAGAVEILEESHYYPFGLQHSNYNSDVSRIGREEELNNEKAILDASKPPYRVANRGYQYKFGGMELQKEFGVEMYDFGARNYDPAIGRWMNIDPMAEMMRRHSPYNYAFNNPVIFIDPDGMMPIFGLQTGAVESYGGFNVTTFDDDGNTIDSKTVKDSNSINIGLDGNIYNDRNSVDAANQGLLSAALDTAGIDPEGTPQQEVSEIEMLVEKVPELGRLNEAGGKPKFDIQPLKPGEVGRYDHPSRTTLISPNAFVSYLYLAFTVGHELNHAFHFHSGLYAKWINYRSNGVLAREYSEYLARRWERDWGNPDASGYMNDHLKNVGGHINNLRRIK